MPANTAGITPIVRVASFSIRWAPGSSIRARRASFCRASKTPASRKALSWLRFPPLGKRGFGVNATMIDYESRCFNEIIDHQNRNTLAVVQFETTTAMERADELLSVKGMDIAMVGPADLSISLGIPGQFDIRC